MEAVMQLANSPVLWMLALASISIVLWQTWLYYKMAGDYVRHTRVLTREEIRTSMKVGVISTVGPAVAVFTVAVLDLIGLTAPPTWAVRISLFSVPRSLAATA